MSYGSVNRSFELELPDPEGLEIGAETFRGRAGVVELLYTAAGPAYTQKLQDAYHEISPVLREFVREQLERERIAPGAGGRR